MNIEGTYTLQAPPAEVWRYLLDPKVLRQTVPGAESVEQAGENTYAVVVNVRQAPLKGMYQGQVSISEQQYPYHYRITVSGEGKQVAFSGAGSISLNEQSGATVIAYKGELVLQKSSSLWHPSLVKGAVKLLVQQFFTALADQLRTGQAPVVEATVTSGTSSGGVLGNIVILPPKGAAVAFSVSGIFQKVVHRLRLGAGDPVEETRWVQRLQRGGVIAGLLLLVWIGTRLPHRQ